jgi:hypothetical protein
MGSTTAINPDIYGVNWPPSASYIQNLGVTMRCDDSNLPDVSRAETALSRWGGNTATAYNPNGHFTNAGNDWYFECVLSIPSLTNVLC